MSAFLLVPQEYACLIETVLAARATMVVWLGPVRSEGGESALVLPEIPDQSPDQVGGEVTMGCGRCSNPPPHGHGFLFHVLHRYVQRETEVLQSSEAGHFFACSYPQPFNKSNRPVGVPPNFGAKRSEAPVLSGQPQALSNPDSLPPRSNLKRVN